MSKQDQNTQQMRISRTLTQYDFEAAVRDCLKHGDIRQIAALLGLSPTYLEQQFNPHDARVSWLFRALSVIVALDAVNADAGDEVMRLFTSARLRAKGEDLSTRMESLERDLCRVRHDVDAIDALR